MGSFLFRLDRGESQSKLTQSAPLHFPVRGGMQIIFMPLLHWSFGACLP
jgi:hypothetical protein